MDTLSHGLWGAIVFGRQPARRFGIAFLLGVAPDLISFGPAFIGWALKGFESYSRQIGEPPDPSLIPSYVYHLYNLTHSFVVWLAVFILIWAFRKKPLWILGAWGLHILCDIPTHSTDFFPTPYLWPFPTPYVNGFRWGQSLLFNVTNYSLLLSAYLIWLFYRRKTLTKGRATKTEGST